VLSISACREKIFVKLAAKERERHFGKLQLIYGDLQKLQLGMAPEDERALIDEVEIFYHCAADVRFDESLKEAIEINVRGTREIINLAQRIRGLNVFVYVSTAFCTPSFDVKEKCECCV
jgi:fatty acyl-CoA reductase